MSLFSTLRMRWRRSLESIGNDIPQEWFWHGREQVQCREQIVTWDSVKTYRCDKVEGHHGHHQTGWYAVGNTPSGRARASYHINWHVEK